MRGQIRKPRLPNNTSQYWILLFEKALALTEHKDPETDSRVKYLRGMIGQDPEKALKQLSILSEVDLIREFSTKSIK